MRVLVCGSRNWRTYSAILERLRELDPDEDTIVEGGQKGADLLARQAALELEMPFFEFPAAWGRHGRPAGPRRNRRMLRQGGPIDLCLAFHEDPGLGTGTKDMVALCRAAGIETEVHIGDGEPDPAPTLNW